MNTRLYLQHLEVSKSATDSLSGTPEESHSGKSSHYEETQRKKEEKERRYQNLHQKNKNTSTRRTKKSKNKSCCKKPSAGTKGILATAWLKAQRPGTSLIVCERHKQARNCRHSSKLSNPTASRFIANSRENDGQHEEVAPKAQAAGR